MLYAKATVATIRRSSARMARRRGALESRLVLPMLPLRHGCTSGLTLVVELESSSGASVLTTLLFRACNPMHVRDSRIESRLSCRRSRAWWLREPGSCKCRTCITRAWACWVSLERAHRRGTSSRSLSVAEMSTSYGPPLGPARNQSIRSLSPAPSILKVAVGPSMVGGYPSPRRLLSPMWCCRRHDVPCMSLSESPASRRL